MLKTSQAAKKLQVSRDTVRRMCEEGLFPNAVRLRRSGFWKIPEADVEKLLEDSKPKVLRRKAAA